MKQLWKSFKSLKLGTKLRTILQLLVYINQIVIVLGNFPLSNSLAYQIVSLILTILITGIGYWYNNDWTGLAKTAGEVFNILKDGKITEEEINQFISEYKNKNGSNPD